MCKGNLSVNHWISRSEEPLMCKPLKANYSVKRHKKLKKPSLWIIKQKKWISDIDAQLSSFCTI